MLKVIEAVVGRDRMVGAIGVHHHQSIRVDSHQKRDCSQLE